MANDIYVVINDDILGYVDSTKQLTGAVSAGILAEKNSCRTQDIGWTTFFNPKIRPATKDDFDNFRVMWPEDD